MRPLQAGDTIGLISPASKAQAEALAGFAEIAKTRGYHTRVLDADAVAMGRMAADDATRARSLMEAFADDSIAAILCGRGGYGSGRLIDLLQPEQVVPKIFVGYSDITSLLLDLNARADLVTFHGPMASDLVGTSDPATLEWFFNMLEGRQSGYDLPAGAFQCWRPGRASGPIWGGNITMIETLLGTDSLRVPENAIIVLEDVNEFMYAFDRSIVHLKRAGVFDTASAILFSDLRLKDGFDRDNSLGLWLEEVIEMNFAEFDGPVALNLPCGHTASQLTLPIGAAATLDLSETALQLSFPDLWPSRKRTGQPQAMNVSPIEDSSAAAELCHS